MCRPGGQLLRQFWVSLVFIQIQLVKFNMGAKRVWNQILDDVLYQSNEFGFYLHESLYIYIKRYSLNYYGGQNFVGQLTRSALTFSSFPLAPKQSCTFVHPCTLYPVLKVFVRPNIVWRGERRAIRGIQAVREVHMMLHLHIWYVMDVEGRFSRIFVLHCRHRSGLILPQFM